MAWVKGTRRRTILAVRNNLMHRDPRFAVSHDEESWRLHIRNTRKEDSGTYMCQADKTYLNLFGFIFMKSD